MPMQESTLSICRAISSSTWSDALDRLRIAGVTRGLAWRSGAGRFAGRATTVSEEAAAFGACALEDFDIGRVLHAAGAGEVLVIDLGGAEISTFGGLAATAARARRVEGVLVDGGCRDLEELRASRLGVVSRWMTPVSGKQRVRVTGLNVPVTCGGVTVSPGDCVIADETGSVVVPAVRFEEVFALAKALDARDRRFREALDNGQDFAAVAAALGHPL